MTNLEIVKSTYEGKSSETAKTFTNFSHLMLFGQRPRDFLSPALI